VGLSRCEVHKRTNYLPCSYGVVHEHLGFSDPSRWATSGASSLGYAGGASVGARLGIQSGASSAHDKGTLVCCITGDGSYMFSIPSTVQHLSSRYGAPFLTIILVNGGWKSPKLSTLLVHPTGVASTLPPDEINVGFGPIETRPRYGSLAQAAAGGPDRAWAGFAVSGSPRLESVLKEAIEWVKGGRSATVEVIVPSF
jgi:acetolactate synthase-1/2/3 large subunit